MNTPRTKRLILWIIPTLIYGLFFVWYTDLGGPLTDEEINGFIAVIKERGTTTEDSAQWIQFFKHDSGRQFLMLNNIDMAEDPPDVEGAPTGATADELMGQYMEHMYVELFKRACHPVIYGHAVHQALDLCGIQNAEHWDAGALFRYRSRRSLMEIALHPDTRGRHQFKIAALEKTIAYPIETKLYLGDLRIILALLLFSLACGIDMISFRKKS